MKVSEALSGKTVAEEPQTIGETTREICARTGIGKDRVRDLLHQYQDKGILRIVKEFRTNLNGVRTLHDVYYLDDEKPTTPTAESDAH